MAFFDRTASPVMGIRPQPVHQLPFGRPIFSRQSQSLGHSALCSTQRPIMRSTSTFAGRKRSRDEAAVNLDEPEKAAQEFARKLVEVTTAQGKPSQEEPPLRSHKSQRLDLTSAASSGLAHQTNGNNSGRHTSTEMPLQPIVDDFTMHLGVGWARLSEDAHIQAAARGWARYIENHFPVTDAKIRLQKTNEAYLVEASQGFFLFSDNLREGRLVSRDAQRALQNLRSFPTTFDGPTMTAVESPRPQLQDPANSTWNTLPSTPQQLPIVPDIDVDMS